MVTKQEALVLYNLQHGTNYIDINQLGVALVLFNLKQAYQTDRQKKLAQQLDNEELI